MVETLETRALLTTLAWSTGPDLPAPRTDAVAVVSPDAIRLLGGEAAAATDAPLLANSATDWTLGASIDTQRNDLGAVQSSTAGIILFGGTNGDEGSDEVLNYDSVSGDSQDLAKMNVIRYDHGFAVDAAGRVYALGGIGVLPDGEIWADAERYDPSSDSWSPIASMPQPLHGLSATGDGDGHVFVFGGSTTVNDSGIQSSAYRYDIATDSWSSIGPMIVGTRDSALAVDADGSIYVTGGMTATGATSAVQRYEPSTNTWSSETALPTPVYAHAAAYDTAGRIIVAGGFDASGVATGDVYRTQDLTVADTAPQISTTAVTSGSLDAAYSYDVNASGNPVPSYALATAPVGMSINEQTGMISWQPVSGQEGIHPVTVQASNRAGSSEQSFDVTVVADTIAPTTPANFALQSATETSLTFGWDASVDASGVDRYEIATAVYTGPRFAKRWVYTVVDTIPGTSITSTVAGLVPLESHTYSIRAVDSTGLVSAWSTRLAGRTLAAPTLSFQYGTQTTGSVQSPALAPLQLNLQSVANPAPVFTKASGPASITVDPDSGVVQWTPTVGEVGTHDVTFRATNSVGSTDLIVRFEIVSDAPQLSVQFNPTTGQSFAVAGTLFTAQVHDGSSTPSTYELTNFPAGMQVDPTTGAITWTPTGEQGGVQSATVRGTNAGGITDLTFDVPTRFTGAVTDVTVTGTSLAEPTAAWVAPTGEGAGLVSEYQIHGFAEWGVGRTHRTHTVNYTVAASETSVLMTGLVTGKSYALTITPLDASGNWGLAYTGTSFVPAPALPAVSWTVNGSTGGTSVPGAAIAEQPVEIVLTDQLAESSDIILVNGPTGLTFDSGTKTATWTPTAADVNVGYANTSVVFEASNSVGTVTVTVPIHIYFSGAVQNLTATKFGTTAATASWDAPTDNVTAIDAYEVTMHWTWSGRQRSRSWTIPGNSTSVSYSLVPTGAVSHKGVTIVPLDADGNRGVSSGKVLYGAATNNLPPIAVDDNYDALEDTAIVVNSVDGVRANDIDTDNTPFINPLTVSMGTPPTNGTVTLNALGAFTYTPDADFNGSDSFTYRLYDGKFYSEYATVTIDVAAVNDAPLAFDDHYTLVQDTAASISAETGLLANDSDIDADIITAALVAAPSNGTVLLNADGSFTYTPAPGFSGLDTFTYLLNDTQADSRIATVNLEVQAVAVGTKFFVVDTAMESTFEYAADGTLLESNSLRGNNRGSQGVAASSDGSTLYVVNSNKRVFVYDDAGGYLGFWTAVGPKRVDGIATDDTDIWILDRKLDTVFHYADAAALNSGEVEPTDSFALHANNKHGKGITTDGTHIWVVDDIGGKDKVYKYTVDGGYVGRWNIDPLNSKPTGITIDPTGASDDIWIVDNVTDTVYQYDVGATRIAGSALADDAFALDPSNTNPQGIADPAVFSGSPSLTSTQLPAQRLLAQLPAIPLSSLHNTDRANDINDDGGVPGIDAIMITNIPNRGRTAGVDVLLNDAMFLDRDVDHKVIAVDTLKVIHSINHDRASLSSLSTDRAISQLAQEDEIRTLEAVALSIR